MKYWKQDIKGNTQYLPIKTSHHQKLFKLQNNIYNYTVNRSHKIQVDLTVLLEYLAVSATAKLWSSQFTKYDGNTTTSAEVVNKTTWKISFM